LIRHANARAILTLPIAVVQTTLRTTLMALPSPPPLLAS
jgi:hypothetical protein